MTDTFKRHLGAALAITRAIWIRYGTVIRVMATLALMAVVLTRGTSLVLADDIRRVRFLPLGAAVVISYVAWVVNSYKWKRLLSYVGEHFGVWYLLHLNLAAIFYGLALPGQISGEVLKAVRLGRKIHTPPVAYASVWLDRLTGVVGLTAVGCAASILASDSTKPVASVPLVVTSLSAVLVLAVIALFAPRLALALLRRRTSDEVSPAISPLAVKVEAALSDSKVTVGMSRLLEASALACLFQLGNVAANWAVALAFGVSISPITLAWIVSTVSLIQLIPVSIGGLGVREVSYVTLLGLYSVPTDKALAVSITMFGLLVLLGITGGALDLVFSPRRPAAVVRPPGQIAPLVNGRENS